MHPIGYKTPYPECPFGLRITDLWLSGMTIVEDRRMRDGRSMFQQNIRYILAEKGGEVREFRSTREMARGVGASQVTVQKNIRAGKPINGWNVKKVERGA